MSYQQYQAPAYPPPQGYGAQPQYGMQQPAPYAPCQAPQVPPPQVYDDGKGYERFKPKVRAYTPCMSLHSQRA